MPPRYKEANPRSHLEKTYFLYFLYLVCRGFRSTSYGSSCWFATTIYCNFFTVINWIGLTILNLASMSSALSAFYIFLVGIRAPGAKYFFQRTLFGCVNHFLCRDKSQSEWSSDCCDFLPTINKSQPVLELKLRASSLNFFPVYVWKNPAWR